LPGGERVRDLANATADRLNTTADYMRTHDLNRMASDVEAVVKNNPGPALLVAAAFGFLLGRAMSRDCGHPAQCVACRSIEQMGLSPDGQVCLLQHVFRRLLLHHHPTDDRPQPGGGESIKRLEPCPIALSPRVRIVVASIES
jgi:hypothetical protein